MTRARGRERFLKRVFQSPLRGPPPPRFTATPTSKRFSQNAGLPVSNVQCTTSHPGIARIAVSESLSQLQPAAWQEQLRRVAR